MEVLQMNKTTIKKGLVTGLLAMTGVALILAGIFTCPVAAKTVDGKVHCRIELDRGVLPANVTRRAILKVTLDAPASPDYRKRPPVNLAIVLDRSGSMSGRKLSKAKEGAITALRRLSPEDIFSLVAYNHLVDTIVPARPVRNPESIEAQIRQIRAGGNTALFGGVAQGASEVRRFISEDYVHRVILLSDGLANVGPNTPEDLGRLGAALIKERISVTTVGVGTDYNEDLMTRLSKNSDGNTYFVESSADLPRIFASELGEVLNVVAQEVRSIIRLADHVRPLRIIGRDGRIRGRSVEFNLNQLYGNQEKYALVEVEIAGGHDGESREIAYAETFYHNPFTRRQDTASDRLVAWFTDDHLKVDQSANPAVQREYELNLNAVAQEEAIALSDDGRRKEAAQALKKSAHRLKATGRKLKDAELLKKAEEMEVQAGKIESMGMSKRARKVLRTESYQMKQQQQSQ
jgi:Ca-activated chloride channel family protein